MPDTKTIRLFREHLMQAKAVENLFARLDKGAGTPLCGLITIPKHLGR